MHNTLTDFIGLHTSVKNINFIFDYLSERYYIKFNDNSRQFVFDFKNHNIYINNSFGKLELWEKNDDWIKFKNKYYTIENARFILKRLFDNLIYNLSEISKFDDEKLKRYFQRLGFDENIQNIILDEFNKLSENPYFYKYTNKYKKEFSNNLTKEDQDFLYQHGFTKMSDSAFCNNDLITISKQDSIYIARVITINDTNQISSATEIKSKEKENQNLEDFTKEVINSLYL